MVNRTLNQLVGSIRQKRLKKADPINKARWWKEKDVLNEGVVDAGVVLLPTIGCRWGRVSGCTMCGYIYEAGKLTQGKLIEVFQEAATKLSNVPYIKIFTSGSFFDPEEVPRGVLDSIIASLNSMRVERVQVESRPEFIKKEYLERVLDSADFDFEVGIGLETSSDLLRENSINKGFTFKDYKKAVELCRSRGVLVKTYLLLKPPFILEREAISDIVKSAFDAAKAGANRISINPMNIQRGTLVELLWRKEEYRPPWIWSLIEALRRISESGLKTPVLSHPTGGGSRRGVHNCGECDGEALSAVREFSLTQSPKILTQLDCKCKKHWNDYLLLE